MKEFNVIWYNFNSQKFEPYDIIPYLKGRYEATSKLKRPKTFDEFKEFVKSNSMYMWWARCEYEIILADWPMEKHKEKWDIHRQIMMNIDIIVDVLIKNLKVINNSTAKN